MKVRAGIYSLHLGDAVIDYINKYGKEKAGEVFKVVKAHEELSWGDGYKPEFWTFYGKTGDVVVDVEPGEEEKVLDDIFAAGNDGGYGPLAENYHRYPRAYSTSVNDIIIVGEAAFIVAKFGFDKVDLPFGGSEDKVFKEEG